MDTNTQILEQLHIYVENNEKFVEKQNKAAATRARKALSELTKLAKERRKEIQEVKNTL